MRMRQFINKISLIVLLASFINAATARPVGNLSINDVFADPDTIELANAVADGDINKIDRLVKEGVDVNAKGTHGFTLLF